MQKTFLLSFCSLLTIWLTFYKYLTIHCKLQLANIAKKQDVLSRLRKMNESIEGYYSAKSDLMEFMDQLAALSMRAQTKTTY